MKLILILNLISVLLISCGSDISGGVEEGNVVSSITGVAISPNGDTLSNIIVDLKDRNDLWNSNEDKIFCDTTDKNGKFIFSNIPTAMYKLSVLQDTIGSIIIDSIDYKKDDTLIIDLPLKRMGAYRYSISTILDETITFLIPGTQYIKYLPAGSKEIIFNGLPEGSSPTIINGNNGHLLVPDTTIIADDTINTNIMTVVMISDQDTIGKDNFIHQRDVIKNMGINVITVSSSQINDSLLLYAAAVYVSYLTDTSTYLCAILKETKKPLIVANHHYFPLLGLTDTSIDTGITYGTEASMNSLIYFNTDSPILKYYNSLGTGTLFMDLGGPGEALWGMPKEGESQRLIVSSRDNKRCHLFTYEKGAQTFIDTLNKRVVGIFTGDITNSIESNKLIEASILWSTEYL